MSGSQVSEAMVTEFNRSRAAALAALVREGKVFVTAGRQSFQNPEWAAQLRHNTPAETAATVQAFLHQLRGDGELRRMAAEQRIEVEDLEDQLREFRESEDLPSNWDGRGNGEGDDE